MHIVDSFIIDGDWIGFRPQVRVSRALGFVGAVASSIKNLGGAFDVFNVDIIGLIRIIRIENSHQIAIQPMLTR